MEARNSGGRSFRSLATRRITGREAPLSSLFKCTRACSVSSSRDRAFPLAERCWAPRLSILSPLSRYFLSHSRTVDRPRAVRLEKGISQAVEVISRSKTSCWRSSSLTHNSLDITPNRNSAIFSFFSLFMMKSLLSWVLIHPTPLHMGKSPQTYGVEAPQEASSHNGSVNGYPKDALLQTR